MKKKILFILLITLLTVPLFASNNEVSDKYQQYEYMVVSFGKGFYIFPTSKLENYFEDGLSEDALSAFNLEMNLDILGKDGWELITVTGVIGGDQQFILKRPLYK